MEALDELQRSPLHVALKGSSHEMRHLLLARGASSRACDYNMRTLAMNAA